jgi:hypothetical protein
MRILPVQDCGSSKALCCRRRSFSTLLPLSLAKIVIVLCCWICLAVAASPSQLVIRAVTAFIEIKPDQAEVQIQQTVEFLNLVKAALQSKGCTVQSIRISTQPFPHYATPDWKKGLELIQRMDQMAQQKNFELSVGPGIQTGRPKPDAVGHIVEILASTKSTNCSALVAATWASSPPSIRAAAEVMKRLALETPGGIGNFSFAAGSNTPDGIPFYPVSYHDGSTRKYFALAVQGATLIQQALQRARSDGDAKVQIRDAFEKNLKPLEPLLDGIGKKHGWEFRGTDCSTAPLRDESIGAALEKISGVPFGESGTLAACGYVTGILKNLRLQMTGYSGLMIPVMEDARLAQRGAEGRFQWDDLLMYSSVCAAGVDVVPIPASTPSAKIEKIILDVATLSSKLHKPLAVRLLLIPNAQPGDMTNFNDPFLVNTKVFAVK